MAAIRYRGIIAPDSYMRIASVRTHWCDMKYGNRNRHFLDDLDYRIRDRAPVPPVGPCGRASGNSARIPAPATGKNNNNEGKKKNERTSAVSSLSTQQAKCFFGMRITCCKTQTKFIQFLLAKRYT